MIKEQCVKFHNQSLRKSFALMCGLCTLKIYLSESDFNQLKEEIKGIPWWNVYDEIIECRKNIDVDKDVIYNGEYQSFTVHCDKSDIKIYGDKSTTKIYGNY